MLISALLCLSGWVAPADDPAVLEGPEFATEVDPGSGRITIRSAAGETLLSLPVGLSIRPAWPPRVFRKDRAAPLERIEGEAQGALAGRLLAVLMELTDASGEERCSLAIRSGRFGPVLIYGLSGGALGAGAVARGAGLASSPEPVGFGHTPEGGKPSVAGVPLAGRSVSFAAPGRLSVDLPAWVEGAPVRAFRLGGRFGIDDSSGALAAARLEVLCDGERLFRSPELSKGQPPIGFDLPLPEARELALLATSTGSAAEPATVDLIGVVLSGPGGAQRVLGHVLAQAQPGLDLLAANERGSGFPERLVPLLPVPWASFRPAPLLVPFRAGSGWWLGVGLAELPEATRLSFEQNRIRLNLDTTRAGADDSLRLILVVVLAREPAELFARYRASLVDLGGAVAAREIRTLEAPGWWRKPLVLARRPIGSGRTRKYDTFEVAQQVEDVERRLGLSSFTLLLERDWNRLPGDPAPAEGFENLRTLIAAQHVKGRKVLLGWDPGAAAPGSLAARMEVLAGDRVVAGPGRSYRAYVRQVAEQCLSDQHFTLNADGLLLQNLERVTRPELGLREVGLVLEVHARECARIEPEALLISACALPQTVGHLGGFLLEAKEAPEAKEATAGLAGLDERAQLVAEGLPELPIFCEPLSVADPDFLAWAVRSAVIGVPVLDGAALSQLDDRQAAALGAVLRLHAERRPGHPERLPDGRRRMIMDERVCAETLERDLGLVVYPERGRAALAVIQEGDVRLPFHPRTPHSVEPNTVVLSRDDAGAAILLAAQLGQIYRFDLQP